MFALQGPGLMPTGLDGDYEEATQTQEGMKDSLVTEEGGLLLGKTGQALEQN